MNYVLEETADNYENTGGGLQFPKPWHAYTAVIGRAYENQHGFLTIPLTMIDCKGNGNEAISVKVGSQKFNKILGGWACDVARSNNQDPSVIGQVVDPTKWEGHRIGVKFLPQMDPLSGYKEEMKFAEPVFTMDANKVADFEPDMAKYNAWEAKHWPKNGSSTPQHTAPQNTAGAFTPPVAPPVIDDDLPF